MSQSTPELVALEHKITSIVHEQTDRKVKLKLAEEAARRRKSEIADEVERRTEEMEGLKREMKAEIERFEKGIKEKEAESERIARKQNQELAELDGKVDAIKKEIQREEKQMTIAERTLVDMRRVLERSLKEAKNKEHRAANDNNKGYSRAA
jgi:hypothetical protein